MTCAVAAWLMVGAVGGSASPLSAEDPLATFSERTQVSLVEVDFWAESPKGVPIEDLRQDEVELLEDGQRVDIRSFSVPRAAAASANESAERAPDGVAPPAESMIETRGVRPIVAIFVDDAYLRPGHRQRVLAALRAWMERLSPGGIDWLLVAFDRSLQVLVPRTVKRARVSDALDGMSLGGASGMKRLLEEHMALEQIQLRQRQEVENPQGTPCPADLPIYAAGLASQQESEASASLGALSAFAGSMAALPGKKLLLDVSDSILLHPGGTAYEYIQALCDGSGQREGVEWAVDLAGEVGGGQLDVRAMPMDEAAHNLAPELAAIAARANANGVTLWTLDAAGLSPSGTGADSFGKSETIASSFANRADAQDVFASLAHDTGGRAILDRNDFLPVLGDLGHDATAGYVLTFESPRAGDGRVHALKLETTRPDVRLRYRRSWRDAPLDEELATRVRGALLFGVDRPGLGATLTLLRRESKPQGDRAVVRITLSEAAVTLLPSAGGARLGELRVEAAVEPAHGSITPVRGRRVDLRLPAAVPDGPPIVSDLELPLGAAGGSVAIGVRDELSGDWAVLRLDVGGH